MKKRPRRTFQRPKVLLEAADRIPSILLYLCTFPYNSALRRNTLDAIQAIKDEEDPAQKRRLTQRFLRFKSNESKYVQVAGAVLFASVPSCLSWQVVPSSHWSARGFFYSSIVLALVAVVSGAQQQMVIPVEEVDNNRTNVDELVNRLTSSGPGEDAQTSNHKNNSNGAGNNDGKSRRHLNHRLIFTLQLPLMLFSLAVVAFLAGLLAIVFGALGSADGGSDDDRKIAVLFGVVVLFLICVSYSSSHWLYKIPVQKPEPSFNV